MPSSSATLPPITEKGLATRVMQLLRERFDTYCLLEALGQETEDDLYVFGGAMRRALFGDKIVGDLDIMVPNGDNRAQSTMDALGVPYVLNSQGIRRYRWNSLQVDLFQPREFFHGFEDIEAALRFVDLRINSLALHLSEGRILDPFHLVSQARIVEPGINWRQWLEVPPLRVVILAIRLLKIMHELPQLLIPEVDRERLRLEVLPTIGRCAWSEVRERYPQGKVRFLRAFELNVLSRTECSAV